jgi:hypothetical protein
MAKCAYDNQNVKALYNYLRYKDNAGLLDFCKPPEIYPSGRNVGIQFDYIALWLTHQKLIAPELQNLCSACRCIPTMYRKAPLQGAGWYRNVPGMPPLSPDEEIWIIIKVAGVGGL